MTFSQSTGNAQISCLETLNHLLSKLRVQLSQHRLRQGFEDTSLQVTLPWCEGGDTDPCEWCRETRLHHFQAWASSSVEGAQSCWWWWGGVGPAEPSSFFFLCGLGVALLGGQGTSFLSRMLC